MLLEIFSLYLQGLLMAVVLVLLGSCCWISWRAWRKLDRTAKERQAFLYEVLMISVMTAPILSFAFMAVLLIIKS
ncbi:DUF4059 family protein [Streptococcus chenjunshii]|uniref:DUF4059 family protein n=1 Tax=Streptococcus chenjunshii TaxID=2173853 RepID=A0A372KJ81_9STRE|nr:DUF4059 family protein [Streptococcus chenjunshii]AXQ79246.1 DUF4059 family protein [Streptococcus chenjunshii]RFU50191.1 DUF4059 family protein [Streptococcus chenjunshii]RFU52362.1 DUF4059 family protein [Streptococcus chenjunshii]